MRGQGTRGTRRGGRMARPVHANPVDDKWKWLSTYANNSSISSPVFNVESGPSAEATDPTLDHLKGKHFAYYHEKRGRYVVCAYKRQATNSKKRKDTKTKILLY